MRLFNKDTSSPSSSSSPSGGPAKAIRLVYCDEKGKFQMDPEAVAVLQLVKEPVGIVSVCGRARQGKSFILNQLLGRSSGFQVAATHRPCTKGLWLWSTPIKRTALDGTEWTYSTQIFSLAVLLSSMFIYSQMGGIDEAALDRLSLVTEMTKHIRVRASGGKTTASELGQFSPIFVWLLRDFYLDLAEDNRKITPRDYLEIALRPVNGGGRDVTAKNEVVLQGDVCMDKFSSSRALGRVFLTLGIGGLTTRLPKGDGSNLTAKLFIMVDYESIYRGRFIGRERRSKGTRRR